MGKRKWFRLLAVIPLLSILIGINIYEDPAGIFHNDSDVIAKHLMEGREVFIGTSNSDERGLRMSMIETMPKHVECIAIGPSVTYTLTREMVGTESFFNLSESAINFNDVMAEFACLDINGVTADRIIFCVDTNFFDENMYFWGARDSKVMPYAEYMIAKLNGEAPEAPAESILKETEQLVRQALSVSYFQASVDLIRSNRSLILKNERWGIVDESTKDLSHYLPDGSWVYSADYRRNTEEDVVRDAVGCDLELIFSRGDHISEYSKEMFVKLLDYLEGKGTQVDFFLCPLSPILWYRLNNDPAASEYYVVKETEEFAWKIAEERGIRVIGTFDPETLSMENSDFWDARHVRSDKMEEYFDFKGVALP